MIELQKSSQYVVECLAFCAVLRERVVDFVADTDPLVEFRHLQPRKPISTV
jgi:hypothetical protein